MVQVQYMNCISRTAVKKFLQQNILLSTQKLNQIYTLVQNLFSFRSVVVVESNEEVLPRNLKGQSHEISDSVFSIKLFLWSTEWLVLCLDFDFICEFVWKFDFEKCSLFCGLKKIEKNCTQKCILEKFPKLFPVANLSPQQSAQLVPYIFFIYLIEHLEDNQNYCRQTQYLYMDSAYYAIQFN